MDKLNMEDYYFHGLAGNISFWNTEEIIKVSLLQLSSIVNTGGIYSRQILKNKFNMEYPYKGYLFNGEDYISVCIKNEQEEEYRGDFYDSNSSFSTYVKYKIALVIEPDCIKERLRRELYRHLPGERHILEYIPLSSIKAVVIGFPLTLDSCLTNQIESILGDIPIIDINGNILNYQNKTFLKLYK